MVVDARLKELAINESGFVFDPHSGGTFTLNATGQLIVKALRDGVGPEMLIEQLHANFDSVTHNAAEDIQDFLRVLRDFGLLSR
jgi:Coenzyme PQQ synthesis protein D (PqqD)